MAAKLYRGFLGVLIFLVWISIFIFVAFGLEMLAPDFFIGSKVGWFIKLLVACIAANPMLNKLSEVFGFRVRVSQLDFDNGFTDFIVSILGVAFDMTMFALAISLIVGMVMFSINLFI